MGEEKKEAARKRARAKMDFIRHFATYVVVIVILIIINNVTGSGYQWWIWPATGWGIGILTHFMGTFVFTSRMEQKIAEKELENMDKGQGQESSENAPALSRLKEPTEGNPIERNTNKEA